MKLWYGHFIGNFKSPTCPDVPSGKDKIFSTTLLPCRGIVAFDLIWPEKAVFSFPSLIEEKIIKLGGTVSKSVTKKVTLLITDNLNNTSNKIEKAKKNKIKIITIIEFNKIYDLHSLIQYKF